MDTSSNLENNVSPGSGSLVLTLSRSLNTLNLLSRKPSQLIMPTLVQLVHGTSRHLRFLSMQAGTQQAAGHVRGTVIAKQVDLSATLRCGREARTSREQAAGTDPAGFLREERLAQAKRTRLLTAYIKTIHYGNTCRFLRASATFLSGRAPLKHRLMIAAIIILLSLPRFSISSGPGCP